METKTRKLVAVGVMVLILAGIGVALISAANTIRVADGLVTIANISLKNDPGNEQLKLQYNKAVKHYIGATAYFPGNLLAKYLGYSQTKWDLLQESQGYTWNQKLPPRQDGLYIQGPGSDYSGYKPEDRRVNST
jgi:hypothetical protein